jgi:hypothetical protein
MGPGGYYNIGNLIGLATGVGLQLTSLATGGSTATEGIIAYFVGSPASVSLTIATIVFLVSGEIYHRAWGGTDAPNTDLNRLADVLSAIGAVALTVSLFYLNQPLLALVTSVLIVGGKLGSAVYGDQAGMTELWPSNWPDLFRSMVLAGRIPGTAAAALELSHQLGAGGPLAATIQPAVMVLCHLFWIRADILLFRDRETS